MPIVGDWTEWRYNPEGRQRRLRVAPASETDALFAEALDGVVEEMRADQTNSWRASYAPEDSGAFGKEVHRRMALRMQGRPGWVSSVWVNRTTLEIASIGPPPPGGLTGFTEIDLLRLRPGQSLGVGQVYNHDLVEELFEIKTSSQGQITPDQKMRLHELTNNRPFKLSTPKHRFTSGWGDHPTGGKMWKIMAFFGVASTAYALLGRSDHQALADETIRKYDAYIAVSHSPVDGPAAAAVFGQALGAFLSARTGQDLTPQAAYLAGIIHLRLAAGR